MKFNEKLIELRKKQGLSQEELGYKLNVTRQTISKWELGQTTPEMDKLAEISKIFNVSVDELINNSEETTTTNTVIEDKPIQDQPIKNGEKKEKKVLIVLVGLLIVVIVAIAGSLVSSAKKSSTEDDGKNFLNQFLDETSPEDEAKSFFGKLFSLFDKAIDSQEEVLENLDDSNEESNILNIFAETVNKIGKSEFNSTFEVYNGSKRGTQLKRLLDEINTNNKKEDRKITVKYNEIETQDTTEIKNLKMELDDSDKFEISFEYDKDGYIYEVTIEKYENNSVKNEITNEVTNEVHEQTNKVHEEINNVREEIKNTNEQIINQNNEVFNQMNQLMNDAMNKINN